jgi:predicted phage tail protein
MSAQEIRLYGALDRMCGRRHFVHLDSKTPAEATRWLTTQFPEARRYISHATEKGVVFAVFRGKGERRENIGVEQMKELGGKVIHFAPVIAGSKRAGAPQTIIGVILIAVSFIPGFQAAAPIGIASPHTQAAGQLALIDPTGIAFNTDGIEVAKAQTPRFE